MRRKRVVVVLLLFICGYAVLIVRLFFIQIVDHDHYRTLSRRQSLQREKITAKRGCIRDRNGLILAQSVYTNTYLKNNEPSQQQTLQCSIRTRIDGRYCTDRVYPYGDLAGSVLGVVGTDGNGLGGVEYAFENFLKGEDGWFMLQRYGSSRHYLRVGAPEKEPADGSDVYLTIDCRIQQIVEQELKQACIALKSRGAMGVVLDPKTGQILAMANYPQFNPNTWQKSSTQPLTNRCISYCYEPGSTFKVITAASALQENIKKESDIIDGGDGRFQINNQYIRDHKAYGKLTFAEALHHSSNVCFAKIATELGSKQLYRYTKDFGLGSPVGLGLPGEEDGVVHPLERWSGRTCVTMAIGQEVSVTLLQMMMAFATIANNGVLLEPSIYSAVINAAGDTLKNSVVRPKRQVVSGQTALRLRRMMRGVVSSGTAKLSAFPGLDIGGKTGTAQKFDMERKRYSRQKYWASFIGFVPVEEPILLCGIVIDEPAKGEEGGIAAAPVFRSIMHKIIAQPELEYAQKILPDVPKVTVCTTVTTPKPQHGTKIPDVCSMSILDACKKISIVSSLYEIVGTGSQVQFQTPLAGAFISKDTKILLYTEDSDSVNSHGGGAVTGAAGAVSMPNCIGKDLRDAVNMLTLKGLIPYIRGSGIVEQQIPPSGTKLRKNKQCILLCSMR
ncbi:MAG: PASTA domain-containing protein [Chitinivibrionales bacterium]|nr:PASTA domain-containing protein [Chitinivibrionales bacterium]